MVDSLSMPPRAEVNEQATWLTPEWIEYFGLSLSVHHGMTTEYQLLEIPSAIFGSLPEAPVSQFGADGPTIDCAFAGLDAAARVSLDRSDAKITVKKIQIAACTVHVVWGIAP